MSAPRHLQWPLKLDPTGTLATNEQDSDADIETAIAIILSYPVGSRMDRPGFGIPEETLRIGGPDLDEIRAAVAKNEPRAEVHTHLTDEALARSIAEVELGYTPRQAE